MKKVVNIILIIIFMVLSVFFIKNTYLNNTYTDNIKNDYFVKELKNQKKDFDSQLKELKKEQDKTIKKLTKDIEDKDNRLSNLEVKYNSLSQEYEDLHEEVLEEKTILKSKSLPDEFYDTPIEKQGYFYFNQLVKVEEKERPPFLNSPYHDLLESKAKEQSDIIKHNRLTYVEKLKPINKFMWKYYLLFAIVMLIIALGIAIEDALDFEDLIFVTLLLFTLLNVVYWVIYWLIRLAYHLL